MRCFSTLLGAMIVAGMCFPVSADVLLDQPRDDRYSIVSEWGAGFNAQMGDDFKPTGITRITGATFWMTATWSNPPANWGFTVHDSTDDSGFWEFSPEYPWMYAHDSGPSEVIDLGPWKQDSRQHVYEIRYEGLDLVLDPKQSLRGTYWFSHVGFTTDSFQESYWITSGHGEVNGERAWYKTTPWFPPGWKPLALIDGSQTDFAFRLEGEVIPVPGVMAPFALLGLLRRRRRRRC